MKLDSEGDTLYVRVSGIELAYLKELQRLGLWGETPAEVAHQLIRGSIRSKVECGILATIVPEQSAEDVH